MDDTKVSIGVEMLTRKSVSILIFVSFFWFIVGWYANEYWQHRTRKIQSTMALISAHNATKNGDYDTALEFAAYALAYDRNSPLADIQIKEIVKRRSSLKCEAKK